MITEQFIIYQLSLKLIHSVIGSTQDFDSWSLGSSPNESTALTLIV